MVCNTYPLDTLGTYKYVVVLSEYQGKILLSRHKERTTWETQGGHIEPGESALDAAKRELYEESGAVDFEIWPLCDYRVYDEVTNNGDNGVVFAAHIRQIGKLPESEMAQTACFEMLPENLTYPQITPVLFAYKDKCKKLLFGTGNQAKLADMRERLRGLPIILYGLRDMEEPVPEITEDGKTPLENAVKKAHRYYEAFHMPVFSCDSGLYIEGIPDELQPGVHVRHVQGRTLTDEEMLAYYGNLAKTYHNPIARYRNAICLVLDEAHVYQEMNERMAGKPFRLVPAPHEKREAGFPLDSISVDVETGIYLYDMENGWGLMGEDAFRVLIREKVLE